LSVLSAITGCPTKQICVAKCPDFNAYNQIISDTDIINQYCDPDDSSNCPTYLLKSSPIFGRCIPHIISTTSSSNVNGTVEALDRDTNISYPIYYTNGTNGDIPLTEDIIKRSIEYISNLIEIKVC
jgi:hypothetical protein